MDSIFINSNVNKIYNCSGKQYYLSDSHISYSRFSLLEFKQKNKLGKKYDSLILLEMHIHKVIKVPIDLILSIDLILPMKLSLPIQEFSV